MSLSLCYLFQGLSKLQLRRLSAITRETAIEKGQCLLNEGQKAEELHVLESGAVELMMRVEEGIEIPIAILRKAGDCVGASALVPPHVYSLSARCVKEGKSLCMKQADLQQLILEDRDLGCIIMTNLARNLLERLKETRQELKIHFRTLFRSMQS